MSQLTYKRQQWSGIYYASSDTHRFAVDKTDYRWCLRIWTLPTLDTLSQMITYNDGFTTMVAAKNAAQAFADKQED